MKKFTVLFVGLFIGCGLYYFLCGKTALTQGVKNKTIASSMRKFIHNKLWRDKGPERMEAVGSIVHVTILDDEQYNKQLGLKLVEEAQEVCGAQSKEDLISEIGDVYEVLDCIIALHNLSREEIAAEQKFKREERGSLLERKFVTTTESIPGSFLDLYCSKDPDKYQLIVD